MPATCNRWFLLQILLLAQYVSGTTMPIIRSSRVLYRWLLPVVFGALAFKLSVWCGAEGYVSGLLQQPANLTHNPQLHNLKTKAPNTTSSNHLYNTLELLMMGIMVPEACWASNKICNKNHLLHLVGILFPRVKMCLVTTVFWCWRFYTCVYLPKYRTISGINSNRLFIFFSNLLLAQVFTTVCHLYCVMEVTRVLISP